MEPFFQAGWFPYSGLSPAAGADVPWILDEFPQVSTTFGLPWMSFRWPHNDSGTFLPHVLLFVRHAPGYLYYRYPPDIGRFFLRSFLAPAPGSISESCHFFA